VAAREELDLGNRLVIDQRRLWRADLSGQRLGTFVASASNFRRCRFEDMVIDSATFGGGDEPTLYYKCSFDRSEIAAVDPGRARFVACSFRDVRLDNWLCAEVEFVYCVFSGEAHNMVFDARQSANEYRGNDFSDMDLRDVAFRGGVDLSQQALPEGDGYVHLPDAEWSLRRAAGEILGWEDEARRENALAVLALFEQDVRGGQRQLLLRRSDFEQHDADTLWGLFDALERVTLV
jgi:uncharacterized protein YjbI with pentapeptide repeats